MAKIMNNPYTHNNNKKLIKSFVFYGDLLGFSSLSLEHIQNNNGDQFLDHIRSTLGQAFQDIREEMIEHKGSADFNLKVFTDNIVIGFPVFDLHFDAGESEFGVILQILLAYQVRLAMDGFFLRGALTYGNHYMDEDIVFGDALIEAHNLVESGGPPRIILSPFVRRLVYEQIDFYSELYKTPHFRELLQDSDDEIFLNYLDQAFSFFPDGDIIFEILDKHKKEIEKNLLKFENNPHIRQKYEWLARYQNFICKDIADEFPIKNDTADNPEYEMASRSAQRSLDYQINYIDGISPRRLNTPA